MPLLTEAPFPIITVAGDPRERGRQHGELVRGRVSLGVEQYMERFLHFSKLNRQAVREEARRYIQPIEAYDPETLEEIRGIAEGAELAFEDVLAMNCRSELMFRAGAAMECSSFAVQPGTTEEGHTYVGQNWDWAPGVAETMILVLIVQEEPKPDVLLLDEAGIIGRMGLNSAGVGLCTNTLISDRIQEGVPYNVLLRGVLNEHRLDEAIGALIRPKRAIAANYIIGHAEGQTIDIELAPQEFDYIEPRDGLITHGNHFAGPRIRARDKSVEKWPDSLYRECRIRATLEQYGTEVTIANMMEALRDRFGHPASVCRYPDPRVGKFDQLQTIASIIIDCTDRACWIAPGPPDAHEYDHYSIASLTAGQLKAA